MPSPQCVWHHATILSHNSFFLNLMTLSWFSSGSCWLLLFQITSAHLPLFLPFLNSDAGPNVLSPFPLELIRAPSFSYDLCDDRLSIRVCTLDLSFNPAPVFHCFWASPRDAPLSPQGQCGIYPDVQLEESKSVTSKISSSSEFPWLMSKNKVIIFASLNHAFFWLLASVSRVRIPRLVDFSGYWCFLSLHCLVDLESSSSPWSLPVLSFLPEHLISDSPDLLSALHPKCPFTIYVTESSLPI